MNLTKRRCFNGKLENKNAIVTGTASGMGKAIAELYAMEGANVLLADFNLKGAQEVSDTLNSDGYNTEAVKTDVDHMIDTAIKDFGSLDILVNNAGIMDGNEPVGEISDEKWDKIFDVNTKGVMRAMRKAVNYWLENDRKGVVVNTISTGELNGAHGGVAYASSKHAVTALTKNTGFMYAEKGIRVNGIASSAVETNIGSSMTDLSEFGFGRSKVGINVRSKTGKAEEIGQVAVFLGSEDSSFINGDIIVADGGWTAAF